MNGIEKTDCSEKRSLTAFMEFGLIELRTQNCDDKNITRSLFGAKTQMSDNLDRDLCCSRFVVNLFVIYGGIFFENLK